MSSLMLAFLDTWQWAVVGVAALVAVIGVVVRQQQRKKAGL